MTSNVPGVHKYLKQDYCWMFNHRFLHRSDVNHYIFHSVVEIPMSVVVNFDLHITRQVSLEVVAFDIILAKYHLKCNYTKNQDC